MTSAIVASLGGELVQARTEGFAEVCGTRICFWRRPVVKPPPGWFRDDGASQYFQVYALAPTGSTFGDASAVMYARAVHKRSVPKKNLAEFIEAERKQFVSSHPAGLEVTSQPPLQSGDGKSFTVIAYAPIQGGTGQFETVAYGEEGDYYFLFVVSARTAKDHEAAYPSFVQLLRGYTEAP